MTNVVYKNDLSQVSTFPVLLIIEVADLLFKAKFMEYKVVAIEVVDDDINTHLEKQRICRNSIRQRWRRLETG